MNTQPRNYEEAMVALKDFQRERDELASKTDLQSRELRRACEYLDRSTSHSIDHGSNIHRRIIDLLHSIR